MQRSQSAGGNLIGCRIWQEQCPSCRLREIRASISSDGRILRTITPRKATTGHQASPERFRYEMEGEAWNHELKRYEISA